MLETASVVVLTTAVVKYRTNPEMARKHHCRHCGRCVCMRCSPVRVAIPKFGTAQEERVCLLCERVLKAVEQEKAT